jgi:hypothetical protein
LQELDTAKATNVPLFLRKTKKSFGLSCSRPRWINDYYRIVLRMTTTLCTSVLIGFVLCSHAEAGPLPPLPRSVSTSRQFIIYGTDAPVRGALCGVTDIFSQILPDTPVGVNMLIGDTTGNKTVNAGDVAQTKGQSGVAVTGANFRNDINAGGSISASDVAQVKANAGHALP